MMVQKDKDQRQLYKLLMNTANNIGVEIVEDKLNRKGGVCKFDGRTFVIYDVHSPVEERNSLILKAIATLDLDSFYLPPRIRDIIIKQMKETPAVPSA